MARHHAQQAERRPQQQQQHRVEAVRQLLLLLAAMLQQQVLQEGDMPDEQCGQCVQRDLADKQRQLLLLLLLLAQLMQYQHSKLEGLRQHQWSRQQLTLSTGCSS
jgi:hypothetical protein